MILLIAAGVMLLFAFVIFFGAPYLPSKRRQIEVGLEMLDVQEGSVIIDLGSGDGVFLKAAAAKGAIVYGYELNPILCVVSWIRCLRYRRRVHIKCANFWNVQFPEDTTGVYAFLITRFMRRLDRKMIHEAIKIKKPLKLASFTFAIPGKPAIVAREGVFLYEFSPKITKH